MPYGFEYSPSRIAPFGFHFNPRLSNQLVHLEFDGLVGHTYHPVFTRGWMWGIQHISGWWEPAPVLNDEVKIPGSDGVLRIGSRLGPRPITIGGFIACESHQPTGLLEEGLDQLARLHRGLLKISELKRGIYREADAHVTDVQISREKDWLAKVTISLQADDPLRYGVSEMPLSPHTILLNPGDARCWPVLELTGSIEDIRIVHPGGTFTHASLAANQTVVVDGSKGAVFNKRTGQRTWDWSGPFPRVDPGGAEWDTTGFPALGSSETGIEVLSGTSVRRFQAWS